MTIKAVFFDLDDTLCNDADAWISCSRVSARIAADADGTIDPENLARAFLAISEAFWSSDQPIIDKRPIVEIRADQWAQALETIGATLPPNSTLAREMAEDYSSRRSRDIDLFPGAINVLQQLRENGMKLVLITNGLRRTHQEKIEALELEPLFDHLIIADDLGHFKPEPEIFQHALNLCGVIPVEAVMVGDHLLNDILGPLAIGMRAILLTQSDAPTSATAHIRALVDLPEALRGIA